MKHVITCIFKNEKGEKFTEDVAVSKDKDPLTVAKLLVRFKNRLLLKGESSIELVRVRTKTDKISYAHDWVVVGDRYVCIDCGIIGARENVFTSIKPNFTNPKYKDCRWKIKPKK